MEIRIKEIVKILVLIFVLLVSFTTTAHATLNIGADVDVPESCSATDTDGVVHNYSGGNSYLAICALEAAINNGSIGSAQLSNQYPSLGLFVTAMSGVTSDPNSQYW